MRVARGADGQRFLAWQRLHDKSNPRTTCRAMATMGVLASPNTFQDVSKVGQAVAKLEFAYTNLQKEFGEELSDRMSTAIVTNMLPLVVTML